MPEEAVKSTLRISLGTPFSSQGLHRRAAAFERDAVDLARPQLGDDHPTTLASMNNLAGTRRALGDLNGARVLHQQTLDARRRVLGDDNPATLTALNNLALTLHALGDVEQAVRLAHEAAEAARRPDASGT